jgi:hypothetical protein
MAFRPLKEPEHANLSCIGGEHIGFNSIKEKGYDFVDCRSQDIR